MGLVAPPLAIDGSAASTLRARLCSVVPPSHLGSTSSAGDPKDPLHLGDLYQEFVECFVPKVSAPTSTSLETKDGPSSNVNEGLMVALGESVAKAGFKIHTSVVEELCKAQAGIQSRIAEISKTSLSILSDLDNFYSNLASPLSATICHSPNFPRGTLSAHFASMQEKLRIADSELCTLRADWDEKMRREDNLRHEFLQESEGQLRAPVQPLDAVQVEALKQEAECIVRDQLKALDDIEAHYKELVQLKTMEMMQFILGD